MCHRTCQYNWIVRQKQGLWTSTIEAKNTNQPLSPAPIADSANDSDDSDIVSPGFGWRNVCFTPAKKPRLKKKVVAPSNVSSNDQSEQDNNPEQIPP
jgi:hypothetical protein